MAEKIGRRKFLYRAGGTLLALGGVGMFGPSCVRAPGPSRSFGRQGGKRAPKVAVAQNAAVWRGEKLDAERVRDLMFRAVRALSGEKSDKAAWGTFFSPDDVVGVKINCIAGRELSNHPETVNAIIAGLREAGVPDGNIIVWDRTRMELIRCGFRPTTGAGKVRYMGTDSPGAGYDEELTIAGDVGSRLSRIVSTLCTALVNAPVLKDHDLCGVTLAMKNYFGAIHNPNKLHDNNCNPSAADLNTMPALRDKTRLIICDALNAQYHGGPSPKPEYMWKFAGLLVSADPVAHDAVGANILETKRKEMGLPTLAKEGRAPGYIQAAAQPSRALGTADLKKMQIIKI